MLPEIMAGTKKLYYPCAIKDFRKLLRLLQPKWNLARHLHLKLNHPTSAGKMVPWSCLMLSPIGLEQNSRNLHIAETPTK